MANRLDEEAARAARADARRLEAEADSTEPYPEGTTIRRPNQPSRMFKSGRPQFNELKQLAHQRHLPMATMAWAWLLDQLEQGGASDRYWTSRLSAFASWRRMR